MIRPQSNITFKVLMRIMFLLSLTSCNRSTELGVADYVSFINTEKCELLKSKSINKIKYKLRLITPEIMVLNSEKINSESAFKERLKNYEGQVQFNFIIEDDNSENGSLVKETIINPKVYSEILHYANTEMTNDLFVIINGDTINCTIMHLEPANSIQPVLRFSVGLSDIKNKIEECTFCFNDNIFNNGLIKFNYSSSTFNNMPKIKF